MWRAIWAVGAILAAGGTAAAQDFQWPTSGTVTQEFYGTFSGTSAGEYYDEFNQLQYWPGGSGLHRAIDIAATTGTPVVAARAGTVTAIPDNGNGYGNHVTIDHGGGYFTLYAHLDSISSSTGQSVSPGDAIGTVGMTGFVTGPHLHFEIRFYSSGGSFGYAVPRYYIPSYLSTSVSTGAIISFDYPGLSSIGSSGSPPPGGGTSPAPDPDPDPDPEPDPDPDPVPASPGREGDNGDENFIRTVCSASSGRISGRPLALLLLLVLVSVWRSRP